MNVSVNRDITLLVVPNHVDSGSSDVTVLKGVKIVHAGVIQRPENARARARLGVSDRIAINVG